jgi:hypothetical protein
MGEHQLPRAANPGGVVVTLRDMYDQIQGLRDEVGELTGPTRALIDRVADQEARLRALERWRYGLPASIVLAGGSTIITLLTLWRH